MLQPHQRAALIPSEPHVQWHQFLGSRFVASDTGFAIVVQGITQQSPEHADLNGLIEVSSSESLPVIFEFTGMLNLKTHEISIQQTHANISEWTSDGLA